ncbi:hypothetical protein HY374_02625 [Candidatus Berkelbacteria bacterium]|nr:hypothetical protein [Candidatus Berkelbacteria bacterium]
MSTSEGASNSSDKEREDACALYAAYVQLGIHGQENKWWMLYIFLMFNSILLLSCATVLVADRFLFAHRLLVTVFSLAGILVDVCWLFMGADYVRASDSYQKAVAKAEKLLPPQFPTPLTEREAARTHKALWGTSGFIVQTVPVVFILIYTLTLALGLCRAA